MRATTISLAAIASAILASAVVPTALADHAYSHRYIVYGRVVDAEGVPMQGLDVAATIERQDVEGQCDTNKPPATQRVTNSLGEYFWCFHTHRMGGSGIFTVGVENETVTDDLDTQLRKSRVDFRLGSHLGRHGDAGKFNTTYTLAVTAWEPGATGVEGIQVEGTALRGRSLTATIEYNGGKEKTATATTNDYGDATFIFDLGEPLQSGAATVQSQRGEKASGPLDPTFHSSTVVLRYPGAPWYEDRGLLGGAIILGLALAAGVGYGIYRLISARSAPRSKGRRAR